MTLISVDGYTAYSFFIISAKALTLSDHITGMTGIFKDVETIIAWSLCTIIIRN